MGLVFHTLGDASAFLFFSHFSSLFAPFTLTEFAPFTFTPLNVIYGLPPLPPTSDLVFLAFAIMC
jgi:hypothetical protein